MILNNLARWQRSFSSVRPPTWTAGMALIPWIGVGILLLCAGSCSSSNGPAVRLYPAPLDPSTAQVSLAVTATDLTGQSSAPSLFTFTSGPFQPLGVTFPVGTRGPSTYQANAYSRPSCPLATGNAALNLGSDDVFDLPVIMKANPVCGPAAMLSLVAGGLGGLGNADGSGPAARFNYPVGVAVDGVGNLYVTDQGNNTIRKVVVATGEVTTLAGTAGMSGGTDGTGLAARFNEPTGVALDGMGNLLYVADYANHTIRKVVVATGAVTTLAGTAGMTGSIDKTGPNARFYGPSGVAVDGAGNLYVADTLNHTIRKVLATGEVNTLAGTASMAGSIDGDLLTARFGRPFGVAADGVGNLYVSDYQSSTIRKVEVAIGMVSTLAGTAGQPGSTDGTGAGARFGFPQGVTLDPKGYLYVADFFNNTIRQVGVATGVVTTLAGTAGMYGSADGTGPVARFNAPSGVTVHGAGNLYVADFRNHTIRQVVVATGAVTTLAVTPPAPFTYPSGVAVDHAGNLYVADAGDGTIRQVVAPGVAPGVVTTLAGTAGMVGSTDGTGPAARFYNPSGVAVDWAGNHLYVADASNSTIRQVVVATGAVTTLAGTAGMYGSADGTGPVARFKYPNGVAVDCAGNLYVADQGNSTIRKVVVATGAVTTLAGTAGMIGSTDGTGPAARFNGPSGVAVDGAGNLYVADTGNGTVRQILVATGSVTTVVGVAGRLKVQLGLLPAGLNHPTAVATLPGNELIILNEDSVLLAH